MDINQFIGTLNVTDVYIEKDTDGFRLFSCDYDCVVDCDCSGDYCTHDDECSE